jgi:type IX secretion system PorP/SprF family membrane protein
MKHTTINKSMLYIFSLIILGVFSQAHAQQDPQFTQYMYNMSVINPAYATSEEGVLNLGGHYRAQWVGLEGGPNTASFFGHAPINEKMQAGVSFTNDNIGDIISENNVYADFAYVLKVSEKAKLSLGLKAGVTLFEANFTGLELESGNTSTDNAFNESISKAFPNVGLGAFYFTEKFYAGLSSPNLLTTEHLESENGIATTGVQSIHFYAMAGYVYPINERLKFKPALMLRGVGGAPLAIDITANVLLNNSFEAGIGYRLEDAVSALVNFKIAPDLRIGYAYDYTLSNLSNYTSGSHEIFLLFDINIKGLSNGFDRSPRFF